MKLILPTINSLTAIWHGIIITLRNKFGFAINRIVRIMTRCASTEMDRVPVSGITGSFPD